MKDPMGVYAKKAKFFIKKAFSECGTYGDALNLSVGFGLLIQDLTIKVGDRKIGKRKLLKRKKDLIIE